MECNAEKNLPFIDELMTRYPCLCVCKQDIQKAFCLMKQAFGKGNKLLLAGNGGSAADCSHIVGELMKGFVKKRKIGKDFAKKIEDLNYQAPYLQGQYLQDVQYLKENLQQGLPSISLPSLVALNTAISNDTGGDIVFAQSLFSLGNLGDVFLGISTSGNSKNIVLASLVAKAKGMIAIALQGGAEGRLKNICDVCIAVPQTQTYKVQELHLPIYHALCLELENAFFE